MDTNHTNQLALAEVIAGTGWTYEPIKPHSPHSDYCPGDEWVFCPEENFSTDLSVGGNLVPPVWEWEHAKAEAVLFAEKP